MGSADHQYIPIEHAPVKHGDQGDTDHWVGCVVLSRWEFRGTAEDSCYLEFYDEDWNGELEQAEGKSKREAIRCLKRLLARTIFNTLKASPTLT